MLGNAPLIAFIATVDADRATAFYRDVLGLRLLERTQFACVFDTPSAQLRVAIVSAVTPAPYTVLGWQVTNLRAVAAELAAKSLAPVRYAGLDQDELGIWHSPSGAHVLWFEDPDGNTLSLTQF